MKFQPSSFMSMYTKTIDPMGYILTRAFEESEECIAQSVSEWLHILVRNAEIVSNEIAEHSTRPLYTVEVNRCVMALQLMYSIYNKVVRHCDTELHQKETKS